MDQKTESTQPKKSGERVSARARLEEQFRQRYEAEKAAAPPESVEEKKG